MWTPFCCEPNTDQFSFSFVNSLFPGIFPFSECVYDVSFTIVFEIFVFLTINFFLKLKYYNNN